MIESSKAAAKSIYGLIIKLCVVVAWLSLLGLTIAVVVGVADRFIFKIGFAWPEAIGRALLIWLSLSGAVLAADRKGHFAAGIIPIDSSFGRKAGYVVRILTAIMLLYFAWSSYEVMDIVSGQEMAGIELSIVWIYIPLPIACFLMAIASLLHGISGEEQG